MARLQGMDTLLWGSYLSIKLIMVQIYSKGENIKGKINERRRKINLL